MARAYTVAAAALALGVEQKWLDNALSHFSVPGVHQQRQGVARKVTFQALLQLSLAVILGRTLRVPLGRALEVAGEAIRSDGEVATKELVLRFDLPTLQADLISRLDNAVEIAPLPRRGRPPKTRTGRLD